MGKEEWPENITLNGDDVDKDWYCNLIVTFLSLAIFYRFPICINTVTSVLIYSNIYILVIKFRSHICFSCFSLDFVQCVNIVEKIGDWIPGSILILVLPLNTYLCDLAKPFNFFFFLVPFPQRWDGDNDICDCRVDSTRYYKSLVYNSCLINASSHKALLHTILIRVTGKY